MKKPKQRVISITDDQVLLSTVAAISYFLFLYLLIHTAVALDGACLYTFWLPHQGQWFSPYWLTVGLVSGFVAWSVFGLVSHIRRGRRKLWATLYYVVATVVLGGWLYDRFWNAMQYERGVLTMEQYFGEFASALWVEPHKCQGI